jgi:hypothetical protein
MPPATQDRLAVDLKKGVIYTLVDNHWVPRKITAEEIQKYTPKVSAGGAAHGAAKPEEEGGVTKAIRGAELGALTGVGVAETKDPIQDTLKGLVEQFQDVAGKRGWKQALRANPVVGIPGAVAKGFGEAVDDINPVIDNLFRKLSNLTGGRKFSPSEMKPVDVEKTSEDLTRIATQLALLKGGKKAAETPISESPVLKAATEGPPKAAQAITGAKYATAKAERLAAKEAGEKTGGYEKAVRERETEIAEQKAAKESRDAKALSETKDLQSQEKARARGEHEAAELKRKSEIGKQAKQYQRDLAEKKKIEADNAKIETARKSLDQTVQQKSKAFTDNMNKVIAEGKKHFDARYGEFDQKVLGKSEAFPKGTATSDLSTFANAVEDAKKNLIEGSPEKIKQFENVIKLAEEGKEFIDTEGGRRIAPGQTIPTVDLRGFVTELDNAIYGRDLLPDVRNALKTVTEAGKAEVLSTVKRIGGDTAVKMLKDLNSDYSDYLTDWRDTSSVNPLPKLRNTLLEGVVQKNPAVLADLDIAKQLQGSKGQTALSLLDKYKKFGADPSILAEYRKALEQMKALDKMKKVPEVAKPDYPERITKAKINPPKPPEIEPFTPRGKDPERPTIEPFDKQKTMRDEMEMRLHRAGNIGSIFPVLRSMSDFFHGNFGGAASTAEQVASIQAIKKLLTSDKMLDWLSKVNEDKPVTERRSPTSKGKGPGGVGRRATEQSVVEETTLRDAIKRDLKALENKNLSAQDRGVIERHLADFREMLAEL